LHKHRIARQIDDCGKPYWELRSEDHRAWKDRGRPGRMEMRQRQSPGNEACAGAGDQDRQGQPGEAAATAHVKLMSPAAKVPTFVRASSWADRQAANHSLRCVSTRRFSGLYGLATRGFALPKPFAVKSDLSIPSEAR
jgi:hypothetical protein